MQRNEINEAINQKTFVAKKLINEMYDLISKDVIRNEIVIKDVEKEFKNVK